MFKTKYSEKLDYDEKYLNEHNLLAILFDKGNELCLMKCHVYQNYLN